MKIAVLGTIHKPIKKDATGGTEIFTYNLVEELVRLGHQVTLFATSDSKTSAQLFSVCSSNDTNEMAARQSLFLPFQLLLARKAVERQGEFDILHNNFFETFLFTQFLPFVKKPVVHTNHHDFFHDKRWGEYFSEASRGQNDTYVFVSHNQSRAATQIRKKIVIYNGIDAAAFAYNEKPGDYFLWLGRISRKKGTKEAVLAARRAGVKLVVAGVIDKPINQEYYNIDVQPYLADNIKTIIRPVSHREKVELYRGAKALLAPISWEEPFGLTLIEAMAAGTPIIAFRKAAVGEIVVDGKTGYLVEEGSIDGLVEKMRMIEKINRRDCRRRVEEKFTRGKTAASYVRLYKELMERGDNF